MKLKFPQQIVIIDDDPSFTESAKKRFETLRCFAVTSFNNPPEAMNFIAENQVRFVVTDINMPNMTGDIILSELAKLPYSVSTAVITNTSSFALALKCYNLGADVYIKPVRNETFLEIGDVFRERILKWNICVDSIHKFNLEQDRGRPPVETQIDYKEYTVLLVEDDKDILDYAKSYLDDIFTLKTAKNGKEALDLLAGTHLIVTDINMPLMDGFKLIEHLESDPSQKIPVIVVSGFLEGNSFTRCPLDIVVMEKPYRLDQLEQNIKKLLNID